MKPDFGARLRAERGRLGYTQKNFAELAGVQRATQYLYEHDDNVPNLRYLNSIAELGADLYFVLFDKRDAAGNADHYSDLLNNIFVAVDKFSRDEKGRPLPIEDRLSLFKTLCETLAGRPDRNIDIGAVISMLK